MLNIESHEKEKGDARLFLPKNGFWNLYLTGTFI
jgi:hypothetical protein